MPKEIIQTERIGHEVSAHGDTNCACSNEIVISWGKSGGAILLGVAEQHALPGDRETSHYTDLGPAEIDQLMKVLRRAKRQIVQA